MSRDLVLGLIAALAVVALGAIFVVMGILIAIGKV
jgi:hypothetical protein